MCKKIPLILLCAILLPPALNAGPLLDKANSLYAAGKIRESITAYAAALTGNENPTLCHFNTANAWFQLDSLPQALVNYRASIADAPDFFKGYLNLAAVYYSLNDMGNCIAVSREALTLDPENRKARLILAAAYRGAGAIPDAVVEFETLADKFPDMEEPFLALGELYRDLGDLAEAKIWLRRFPAESKNADRVWSLLTELCENQEDYPGALFYNQQILNRNPSHRNAWYRAVQLQRKTGNDLVAFETARQAMNQFPEFSEIALLAGSIAFDLERWGEAEYCFEKAEKAGSPAALIGLRNIREILKHSALHETSTQ